MPGIIESDCVTASSTALASAAAAAQREQLRKEKVKDCSELEKKLQKLKNELLEI